MYMPSIGECNTASRTLHSVDIQPHHAQIAHGIKCEEGMHRAHLLQGFVGHDSRVLIDHMWNVPNAICLLRIGLVFYCIHLASHPLWFVSVVALAVALDALDGYAARRLNQCTEFGMCGVVSTGKGSVAKCGWGVGFKDKHLCKRQLILVLHRPPPVSLERLVSVFCGLHRIL